MSLFKFDFLSVKNNKDWEKIKKNTNISEVMKRNRILHVHVCINQNTH